MILSHRSYKLKSENHLIGQNGKKDPNLKAFIFIFILRKTEQQLNKESSSEFQICLFVKTLSKISLRPYRIPQTFTFMSQLDYPLNI